MSSNNENTTNSVIDSSNNEVDLKVENNNEYSQDDSCCNDECCNENESCCEDNDCCNNECCDNGFDSDSEEYHKFIENMQNNFSQIQTLYSAYCKHNNKQENIAEMFSLMDILQGGTGKMICLSGEDELTDEDKKYVKTLDEFNAEKEKQNDNQ